jgi:ferredoxin
MPRAAVVYCHQNCHVRIEKGRKTVSPERAAKGARLLGYPETVFVRLAAGLRYKVEIEAACRPVVGTTIGTRTKH